MAKKIYIGVSNIARKVASAYIGVSNVARKIKKAYLGVNNVAKLIYESHKEDEELPPFTGVGTSTWTVPSDAQTIDIFCVGGGGGAGGCMCHEEGSYSTTYYRYDVFGASGGSGYTTTAMGVAVTPGETLTIVIGAGGAGGTSYSDVYGLNLDTSSAMSAITNGADGGTSGVYRGSTALATAAGGKGGLKAAYAGVNTSQPSLSYINFTNGSNGGCGSGVAGAESEKTLVGSITLWGYYQHSTSTTDAPYNTYGENGKGSYAEETSGGQVDLWRDVNYSTRRGNRASQNKGTPGTGQNSNTRKYGLSGGTVYSVVAGSQTAGTGNSGALGKTVATSKAGSSGVVIITVHYS